MRTSRKEKALPLTPISYPIVGSTGKTGSWRFFHPVIDYSKCTKCLLCWVYCPDAAISRRDENSPEIYYEYCKGCGICANECPSKAISIQREEK